MIEGWETPKKRTRGQVSLALTFVSYFVGFQRNVEIDTMSECEVDMESSEGRDCQDGLMEGLLMMYDEDDRNVARW